MNLCIDQGNSSTKVGLFEGDKFVENKIFKCFGIPEIGGLFKDYPIDMCIFSSVASYEDLVINELSSRVKTFIELSAETPISITNAYKTPETLGKDRLAAVVGASFLKPDTDILVIDAGSAITYDFIDKNKLYHGGNISPGVDLRFKALHYFTDKLPLVKLEEEVSFLGDDTKSAILSGVINGICFEMDGYINSLRSEYHDLSAFLTGGDTIYFANKLKNAIFANTNLVLIGLNRILQYNV